jgi:hypothetical protein
VPLRRRRRGTGGLLLPGDRLHGATGQGPDDVGELPALRRVSEDDGGKPTAVYGAVGSDDPGTEGRHERCVALAAGPVDAVRDAVGVDDVGATGGEESRDLALAAGDAAGEADGEHG